LASSSSALNPDTVGDEHYQTAIDAQALLKRATSLERIVALIGESELSTDDQTVYKRSKKLKNYMTQNFTVVENQTEKKGVYVPAKETVADVKAILEGKVDQLEPEDLLYIGTLKDVEQKVSSKTNVSPAIPSQPEPQNIVEETPVKQALVS
jgi:F-type H+/Na+-transporting ATPase subunit beta